MSRFPRASALTLLLVCLMPLSLHAQAAVPAPDAATAHAAEPLWPNGAPDALGAEAKDIPTLTRYAPGEGKAKGATMLVLPGGGYGHLAEHEGKGYAEWFAAQGVTAYVLKYRLGPAGYRHPAMLNDAARALRTLRARAPAEEPMTPPSSPTSTPATPTRPTRSNAKALVPTSVSSAIR